MSRVLIVLALLAACLAALFGFELVTADGAFGHPLGWLGLALAFFFGASLA